MLTRKATLSPPPSALCGQFIRELFKPQEMYTSSSTREIFNKLAHSSIMRLNESSMDKLYDLMTMGFKHQVRRGDDPGIDAAPRARIVFARLRRVRT